MAYHRVRYLAQHAEVCFRAHRFFCRADRGVGLEILKLLLASPSNLILVPVYRTAPFGGLAMSAKGRLHLIPLDGDDGGRDDEDDEPLYGTVRLVSSIVGEGGIDYLLNYAVVVRLFRSLHANS